jgi:YHS domain-containing protein
MEDQTIDWNLGNQKRDQILKGFYMDTPNNRKLGRVGQGYDGDAGTTKDKDGNISTNSKESIKDKISSLPDGGKYSTHEKDGKTYDTVYFTSEEKANAFMEKNPGTSVIGTQSGGEIHVASDSDSGTETAQYWQKTIADRKAASKEKETEKFDASFFDDYDLTSVERKIVNEVSSGKRGVDDLTLLHDDSSNIDSKAREYLSKFITKDSKPKKEENNSKAKSKLKDLESQLGASAKSTKEGKAYYQAELMYKQASNVLKENGSKLPNAKKNYDSAQRRLAEATKKYKNKMTQMIEEDNSSSESK